jgi:hypothetical protein
MPVEDIEFYDERRHLSLDVLSPGLISQLSHLVWRVLQADGRESSYVDENDRLLSTRVARLENVAIRRDRQADRMLPDRDRRPRRPPAQSEGAPVLLRGRRLHDARRLAIPPASRPDIWYNMAVTTFMLRLDGHA